MHEDDVVTEVNLAPVPLPSAGRPTASLVVIAGEECTGRLFRLEPGELLLGRASDAHVRLEGPGISRHHARLRCLEDGTVEVEDLGSRNGTWVRGERVTRCLLRDGDRVQVGLSTLLKLCYQDPLELAFQEALYASATRDGLTGALNQKSFREALQREFSFCARRGTPLCLVLLDVDHFKRINDTHGHPAGDAVLSQLGEVLRGLARAEDVVARVGGEEFAFLLRDCAPEDAVAFAERVCRRVEDTPFVSGSTRLPVSVSLGVAALLPTVSSPEALVALADHALYEAKARGRNQVVSAQRSVAA